MNTNPPSMHTDLENGASTPPYRVLIVDDHPLSRKAIFSLLEGDSAFFVIGEAYDGEEALLLCGELNPDLVLMDINMSPMNGLEATRLIKQRYPGIRIVILTVSDNVADLFTALQFGAQGYLLKNMDPDEWRSYLHALLDDNSAVAREMAARMLHHFQQSGAEQVHDSAPLPALLTVREREIAACVANGDNNRQIANQLHISENTVKNHIKNIFEKLSFDNRVQLAAYAVKHGLSQKDHNK